MEITATYEFPAPQARVWELLMDPVAIADCIPGCRSLEADGENRYRAKLDISLAAITGSYDGVVTLTDVDEHRSYRLVVEGNGRPGFVKGDAVITLRPELIGTIVEIHGTVHTGGPIARMGQRLIGGVAKMMQDRFFSCMMGKI